MGGNYKEVNKEKKEEIINMMEEFKPSSPETSTQKKESTVIGGEIPIVKTQEEVNDREKTPKTPEKNSKMKEVVESSEMP